MRGSNLRKIVGELKNSKLSIYSVRQVYLCKGLKGYLSRSHLYNTLGSKSTGLHSSQQVERSTPTNTKSHVL